MSNTSEEPLFIRVKDTYIRTDSINSIEIKSIEISSNLNREYAIVLVGGVEYRFYPEDPGYYDLFGWAEMETLLTFGPSGEEKQTPKEPITTEGGYACPVCDRKFYGRGYKYCPKCGQVIDWSFRI